MGEIVKFPEIREYTGLLTIGRDFILPYANIGKCKVMDYKDKDGNEEIIVSLAIQGDYRISIIAQSYEEAEEIVRELTKIRMNSSNRKDSIKSNYIEHNNKETNKETR